MTKGVAKTWTPWFPIACAVRSEATIVVTSAVAPGSRAMTQSITPERADGASEPCHHTRRMVRWVAAAGAFVVSLDSMVNIAFPVMAAAFGIPPEHVRWIIVCYVGSYSVTSFVAGAAADRVGHLRVFRAGLALSVAGFALCGGAPSFGALLAGRAVQGIAGGLVYGTVPALATLGAAPARRGRRLGFLNAAIGLGFASGPLVAGVLVDALGGRAGFHARVPVALVSLALCAAGFGLGVFQVPNMLSVMAAFPARHAGAAGGLAFLARTLGVVTGVLVLAAVFAGRRGSVGFQPAFAETFALAALAVAAAAVARLVARAYTRER